MIKDFVNLWYKNKNCLKKVIEDKVENKYIFGYRDLLAMILKYVINDKDYEYDFSTENIKVIDDGDYEGTLIYVFHKKIYCPNEYDYYFTCTYYGSCSFCDTMMAINDIISSDKGKKDIAVRDLMTEALHLIQNMRKLIPNESSSEQNTKN